MSELTQIPANLQTDFLVEVESDIMPEIRRSGNTLQFPVFIRAVSQNDEHGDRTVYRYFEVAMPFTGQPLNDYTECKYRCYAALRRYFYGDYAVQNEQILKGTFAAHQYAVKLAFPRNAGEVIAAVTRFNTIKADFWTAVDSACAMVEKTRADLPTKFNAEAMLLFAATNGMSAADIGTFTAKFSVISLNLLQNNRNWDELFNE